MYKLYRNIRGDVVCVQKQTNEILISIPFDPANTDYQEFLRWCEAGNEPLPPDSQE